MNESTSRTISDAVSWVSAGISAGMLPRRICPSCGWFWRCCTCVKVDAVDAPLRLIPEPLRGNKVMKTADDWAKSKDGND